MDQTTLKIGTLQYSFGFLGNFSAFEKKIGQIVQSCAKKSVQLLLFPEYLGLEANDSPAFVELFKKLSAQYGIWICSGTDVVQTEKGTFNRAYLFSPSGKVGYQDKCNLTPDEVEEGILRPGSELKIFETPWGKVGICVCYDCEFPLLAAQMADVGVELLLVPSYTTSLEGFYRVLVGCQARALENQFFVAQSCMLGQVGPEMTYGAASLCTPIDAGFPQEGLLQMGQLGQEELVVGMIDFHLLKAVRTKGQTHNFIDGKRWKYAPIPHTLLDLR